MIVRGSNCRGEVSNLTDTNAHRQLGSLTASAKASGCHSSISFCSALSASNKLL